ncbi:FtsX-like permease family protein [Streptomyces lancefieldiae]|uniref:FtsX-like permease family protein n=1 Tax=Streptomyces lancefieldiae TaxID=3075520 RepID=A0ABU3ARJ4_9ACTN|nr:FtsX-like permease family protein [Streptomyces sp. DSM 40712]MDT0612801.1 FtsX-like permease family protein [Streptomyces sp. DSM 40712]
MTGFGGLAGFVLLRARAHRLLLAAALLTVLLTTAVLTTLTAYSGAIGDAALRHALRDPRNTADAALIVKADVPKGGREDADRTVRTGARDVFDGLPVTVRPLVRSGPYGLPETLRPRGERSDDPNLTYFAALDPGQVRVTEGRMPREADGQADGRIEAALPTAAAERLHVRPGTRLALTDRLGGPPVRVEVTGLYRPTEATAPYWRLDDLAGRGVKQGGFTTYGPLLAAPGVLTGGEVSSGPSGWLATADFSSVTTDRTDALRAAARDGTAWLRGRPVLSGTTAAGTSLPEVLDRLDRSLLVSRSTLLVVALQLALLAGCALLLVARLLSAERASELRLLRARGASRARIAGLAALEALLLAVPALVCAPLLAGPLTRLLAGQGSLARIGLRLQVPSWGGGTVWLVAGVAALGCALAVTLPALTASLAARGRARALPAPLRAGADVGLLVVAGVAYWQLSRQTSGAVTGDSTGALGIDPLLVAAPALALLAGTVLTLRLLPPVARLAERRAAGGRGLTSALAGWQLSRRPMRGAGPVLLLVLAVALGMLAVGQGASWDRSQDDQADFRAGAPVRLLAAGSVEPGRTETYAAVPGVTEAAPAARAALPLSGGRTATVLALDTAHAKDTLLLRPDLSPEPARSLLSPLDSEGAPAGAKVPGGTARLGVTATLHGSGADTGTPTGGDADAGTDGHAATTADVTVTVQDGYGTPFRLPAGELAADGRSRTLDLAVSAGPLTVTGLELVMVQPIGRAEQHRLTLEQLTATAADGTVRRLPLPASWTASVRGDGQVSSPNADTSPTKPRMRPSGAPSVEYGTGYVPTDETWAMPAVTVRLNVVQPPPPQITAVATDRFLDSVGARTGQRVDVTLAGRSLPVRIVRSVRALPTTAATEPTGTAGATEATDARAKDGGGLLVDLRSVNRVLQAKDGQSLPPTEWWLRTEPGDAAGVAAALRAFPDLEPGQVVVRDELAGQLRDDPFGAGPETAFAAAAGVAAALAAVGFAVSATGSLRARGAEFAILRALGAPRRRLARTVAVEQGVLLAIALLVGTALGAVLARAVIPLIVLTPEATHPVPDVLVALPATRVAVLLAATALTPLLVTAALALRRADPAATLREQGGEAR